MNRKHNVLLLVIREHGSLQWISTVYDMKHFQKAAAS